jgi:hypothetical protein
MAYEPDLFPSQGRSNIAGKVTYHVGITYGSSAVASYYGKHVTVADTATGKMTITLPRSYGKLTGFRWGWTKCAAGAVYFPVILTNNIATDGTLVVETRAEAGTASDPASGDELFLEFDVSLDHDIANPVTTL